MSCIYKHAGKDYNSLEEAFKAIKTSNEIYERMIPIISQSGITLMGLKEYEKHLGISLKDNVNAVADLANMIIATDDISTLPEEFSHFVEAQYVGTDVHNYLLEQVRQLPIYDQVKEDYKFNYKDEVLFAREALGKLMHQVIVEKSTRSPLRKILMKLFTKIRKAIKGNKDLKVFLEEITDKMMNQEVEIEATSDVLYNVESLVEESIESLKKIKKKYKIKKTINNILVSLEIGTPEEGITKLVNHIKSKGELALKEIKTAELNSDRIADLHDFINTYKPIIKSLKEYQVEFDEIVSNQELREIESLFSDIETNYNVLRHKQVIKEVEYSLANEFGFDINDPDLEQKIISKTGWNYKKELREPTKNVSFFTRWFGSLHDASNEVLRYMYQKVFDINARVRNNSIEKIEGLYQKAEELGLTNLSNLFERVNGKLTGYFNVGYRLDDFYKAKEEYISSLKEKYGLSESQYQPEDLEERKKFNKELNDWLEENTERPFIKEYYDIRSELSDDTVTRLEDIQSEIRLLTTRKGKDLSKYKPSNIKQLNDLRRKKKNLANIYYENGTLKSGVDLKIANQLTKFYEQMDKLYSENQEEFERFTKNMTPLEKSLNEQIIYDDTFWKQLEELEKTEYGEEYDRLNKIKKELLKLFRIDIQNFDVNAIPENVKKEIISIELQLRAIRQSVKKEKVDLPFKMKTNPEFHKQFNKDPKWLEENTIDGKNPAPFWTYIEPKDKSLIKRIPSSFFIENNENSKFANPNYDKDFLGTQPSVKWKSNQELSDNEKEMLNYIISLKKDIDYDLPIKENYKVPQVLDTTLRRVLQGNFNTILEGMKKDLYTNEDDVEFLEERVLTSKYTKMVDNPELLSTDLLGTMSLYINQYEHYVQYQKEVSNLELLVDELDDGTTRETARSFVDHHVYSVQQKALTIPDNVPVVGNMNVTKLINKFSSYTRALNLGWNPFTTLSGAIQSNLYYGMEKVIGEFVSTQSGLFARGEFMKQIPNVITEIGSVNKHSELYKKMQKFGLVGDVNFFKNLDLGNLSKKAIESGVYWSYELVDFYIKGHGMIALLDNYRKVDGQWITRQEAIKQNKLDKYKHSQSAYDADLTDNEFNIFNRRVNYIINKIDGKLNKEDYSQIHRNAVGQMVAMHRGWLFSGISKRFRKAGFNYSTHQIDEGYIRTTAKFVNNTFLSKERIRSLTEMLSRWNELSNVEKNAIKRTIYEMILANIVIQVAFLLNGLADDEDDWKLDSLAYLSNRVVLETNAFNISRPLMITKELTATVKDPFVPMRTFEQSLNFGDMLFGSEEIEQGIYKGMTKRERAIIRLLPFYKSIKQAENPEASNQFLKSKILNSIY